MQLSKKARIKKIKTNIVYFKSSTKMEEIKDNSIDLIITSPPYFNIKNYSLDGKQINSHSLLNNYDIGNLNNYADYMSSLLNVWKECFRVLKPNGKLCINTPLMPMLKKEINSHHNRHMFDLNSDIQNIILTNTKLFLMDTYIWNRTNSSRNLMFGSYPYPPNFYSQNTIEFITIYVKDGKPKRRNNTIKQLSKLSKQEWLDFTKQVWDIPIPNKKDLAYGIHPAIMPEQIVYRLLKLYSFVNDIILDPFAGSGTTLKIAQQNNRKYIGYEIYNHYQETINQKLKESINENEK